MLNHSICLICGADTHPVVRSRIDYAFRVFAAIYGYCVVVPSVSADICCIYGDVGIKVHHRREVRIHPRYTPRPTSASTPILQKNNYAGEDFYLVHGVDETSRTPDWLGEIFEWLSGGLETDGSKTDAVGRIPYKGTVFHQQQISPFKPYAGLLMAWLENVLQGNQEGAGLIRAESPASNAEHSVICSHDIDFYRTSKMDGFKRVTKNMMISARRPRSASFFLSNARMATDLVKGRDIGDYIPKMLDAIESMGFRSTLFAVTDGTHRRDPNYCIEQIAPHLRIASTRGFGIGVHASYDSMTANGRLRTESKKLGAILEQRPLGSRQHWLRFSEHRTLYRELHEAGLAYDSSLGFAETCGFRNGANFAFPPYDFENERPCDFLEIPLVIMDGALHQASQNLRELAEGIADRILVESRKWGWGGVSILWHNPMEPIQVPEEINAIFWKLAKTQSAYREKWMSAEQFMKANLPRYQCAGLLKEVSLNAQNAD
jgi:hypothetical protein